MKTPEQRQQYAREYYLKNRERISVAKKDLYQTNPGPMICRARQWAIDHPKETKAKQRAAQLKSRYGIVEADYQKMFDDQRGLCKICHNTDSQKLSIDHCHYSGKVRGLLCAACNKAIGLMKDSPERLRAAADYLVEIGSDKHLMSIINQIGA